MSIFSSQSRFFLAALIPSLFALFFLGWAGLAASDTITKDNIEQVEDFLTPATRLLLERGMSMEIQNAQQDAQSLTQQQPPVPTQKVQAGISINADTADTMEQVADLLTPATRWMLEQGMLMTTLETKPVRWPQAYHDATRKYSGQVRVSIDGRVLHNYIAGAPFPRIDTNDPLAGYKIMWNFVHGPAFIDNIGTDLDLELISSQGAIERRFRATWRRMMWTGRLYTDPKPVAPYSPALRHTDLYGPYSLPREKRGWMALFFRYLAQDQPDDLYLYIPVTRSVERLQGFNRGESVFGMDMDPDSFWGFNGRIHHWTFKVLAEKDILAVVHSGKYGDQSAWCAPRDGKHGILAALPCVLWEQRRVWVIEATPSHFPGSYAYAKRILYIDQDFFGLVLEEMYDLNGEFWRFYLPCIYYTKTPYWGYPIRPLAGGKYNYEDEWPFIPNTVIVDVQNTQATTLEAPTGEAQPGEWLTEWYFNEDVKENTAQVYSTNYLLQSAR